jgi:Formate hydrogenlyase subunit 3/Multisubunit Na+/H+ antiporter, MnhD subunit
VSGLLHHLPVMPIVVPLLAGALMLFLSEARRAARATIALTSMVVQLAVGGALLYLASDAAPHVWSEGIGVYRIGNWPSPFGIVLVVDRLSALMVTLGASLGFCVLVYTIARWDRPGQPFHSLLQFLMMGLNGAFLTGDLFNLFVFFEVLLAASYGLVLRGTGATRVKEGLHYIVVNLVASFMFLIGVSMVYGIAGTLNMAELTGRVAALSPADRALFDVGGAILGIAFLVKAGSWPLNLWLPGTYSVALAPIAASFAMLTKVGVYAVLRVGTLMSHDQAAASLLGPALFYIGLATLVAGTIGMLSALHLARLVSHSLIVSTGIMLAALGLGIESLTPPVLFYLIVSVLTSGAFFLLTGMTERTRARDSAIATAMHDEPRETPALPYYVAFGVREPDPYGTDEEVGVAIPAAMAFLGLMFVCCVLLVTGLPPLPGFVAKFTLLSTAIGEAAAAGMTKPVWVLTAAVLATGLAGAIALTRIGMSLFWTVTERTTPRLHVLEAAPVALLVLVCLTLGAAAGPVMGYLESTARSLHDPQTYIRTVLAAEAQLAEAHGASP